MFNASTPCFGGWWIFLAKLESFVIGECVYTKGVRSSDNLFIKIILGFPRFVTKYFQLKIIYENLMIIISKIIILKDRN